MRYGFDLDGTLDRAKVLLLMKQLLALGNEIHVISGYFADAGDWQSHETKLEKLNSLLGTKELPPGVSLHTIYSYASEGDSQSRRVNIGLQKGIYCQQHGIEIMFDDSETYAQVMKAMAGDLIVCHVR